MLLIIWSKQHWKMPKKRDNRAKKEKIPFVQRNESINYQMIKWYHHVISGQMNDEFTNSPCKKLLENIFIK